MNNQLRPRYEGISTCFRTDLWDGDSIDVGIIGIPFDGGVTNRPGARFGPKAVREQSSLLRTINSVTGISPFTKKVQDLGDIHIANPFDLCRAHDIITDELFALLNKFFIPFKPLIIGGDHSISYAILRAFNYKFKTPLAMIHIDAHCDTGNNYLGSRFHHGCPFYNAVVDEFIDPKKTIQIGIRGTVNDVNMWSFSYESGMTVLTTNDFYNTTTHDLVTLCKSVVGNTPCYLTFDIDSIDPAEAPGTGTPEAGGISMRHMLNFLQKLENINFVGADLVEVAPQYDYGYLTAFNAASILFEELCLLVK